VTTYNQEDMLSSAYMRKAASVSGTMQVLAPHSAGLHSLNLLHGYRSLMKGELSGSTLMGT